MTKDEEHHLAAATAFLDNYDALIKNLDAQRKVFQEMADEVLKNVRHRVPWDNFVELRNRVDSLKGKL